MYNFLDLARDVLSTVKLPLSAHSIWEKSVELGISKQINSSGKTPWNTIAARVYMEIKDNPNSDFIQISKRPAKFYLKGLPLQEDINENIIDTTVSKSQEDNVDINKAHERDLHPLLTTFVFSNEHFKCHTKTIYHENSRRTRKGYNEWLHPDLVGVYFPFEEYQDNTLNLINYFNENSYKLFSFEMKIDINFSNLRASYFQAVSNSSWAHEGYLVTLKIDDDSFLIDELRRLNNAFGIGIIKLNPINIEQSEILFSAKTRETLDWTTIDRLNEENPDFSEFTVNIMDDIKVKRIRSTYDKAFTDDDSFKEYVISKRIVNKDDFDKI